MTTHISVLPVAVVDALTVQLNEKLGEDTLSQPKLNLLRLPHPRTGLTSLFLPVKASNGVSSILELQNVAPNASRSWFNGGEVISDGNMLLMTPVDPVFLLVPLLKAASPLDGSIGNYRTLDDILEDAAANIQKLDDSGTDMSMEVVPGDVMELSNAACIHEAMQRMCEAKEIASDLVVFRYSHSKLVEYLVKKTSRIAEGKAIEKSRTLERELAKDGLMDDGKEDLLQSGRLKLACDLISQYISPDLHQELLGKFDFSALTEHVAALEAATSFHETTSGNGAAQKVQKKEEMDGKKRKAAGQGSTGVAKLKKANITGMSKLSSFFQNKS